MTSPGQSAPRQRRTRIRKWLSRALFGLVVIVLVAAGTVTALVQFAGYCTADFIPIDTDLEVPPYVQNVSGSAATVMWRTPVETAGTITFGDTREMARTASSGEDDVHTVRLTGLKPDTTYYYRVQATGIIEETRSFRTPPGPQGEMTFAVVGDTGTGSETQERISEVMLAMHPDLVLHTGDVVYPRGGVCHYDDRYYEPYKELIASVPVYPVIGNHDLLTDNGAPYLTAFELPEESSGNERFYSFDAGPIHVAALDSELYHEDDSIPASRQKAWLKVDLRSTDRPWKIVVIHRPPFSSSPYHGGDQRILEDLVGIFEEQGVDVVFAGHEHVYERLKPINGVTYFVTGGGGGELRSVGTSELTAVSALRHHALKVQATPERLVVEAIDIDGDVFDQVELLQASGNRSPSQVPHAFAFAEISARHDLKHAHHSWPDGRTDRWGHTAETAHAGRCSRHDSAIDLSE